MKNLSIKNVLMGVAIGAAAVFAYHKYTVWNAKNNAKNMAKSLEEMPMQTDLSTKSK